MKKAISILLTICLSVGIFSVTAAAEDVEYYPHDVNKDGKITVSELTALYDVNSDGNITLEDARSALRIAAGIDNAAEGASYDVNRDGRTGVDDARLILRASIGLDTVFKGFNNDELLAFLCSEANWVKVKKPGFVRDLTSVCSSMKITTSGFPLLFSYLNVKNIEFTDYVDKMKVIMKAEEYEKAKAEADAIYVPVTDSKEVAAGASGHYSYYPVNGPTWSMNLTTADIKSISVKISGTSATFTVLMNNYTYAGTEYPSLSSERQKLPYGKAFNIPAYRPSSGYTLDSFTLKDGKITYTIDMTTGNPTNALYYYAYEAKCSAVQKDESLDLTINMATTQNSNVTENYKIAALAS